MVQPYGPVNGLRCNLEIVRRVTDNRPRRIFLETIEVTLQFPHANNRLAVVTTYLHIIAQYFIGIVYLRITLMCEIRPCRFTRPDCPHKPLPLYKHNDVCGRGVMIYWHDVRTNSGICNVVTVSRSCVVVYGVQ